MRLPARPLVTAVVGLTATKRYRLRHKSAIGPALEPQGSAMSNDQVVAMPAPETKLQSIYRFKLGAFEVTNLLDGFNPGRATHPTFAGNRPAETVYAHARANGVARDKYEHVYVNTLVNTGK